MEGADLDVKNNDNFYFDDGITSCETTEQAVKLIKQTQRALYEGGRLRLHKIASNDKAVLEQFDTNNLTSNLKTWILDLTNYRCREVLAFPGTLLLTLSSSSYHQNQGLTHVEVCCQ